MSINITKRMAGPSRPTKLSRICAALALMTLAAGVATAQTAPFPSRTLELVVPSSAGGSLDAIARAIGPKLSETIGKTVIVDNRPGAGSLIGARRVRGAPPDGHTILIGVTSMALNSFAYKNPGYKMSDFVPVGAIGTNPFLFIVNSRVPARSVAELVAHSKVQPGTLNAGSLGPATVTNLCFERFKAASQLSAVSVNFPATPPAMTSVMNNTIQMLMAGVDAAQQTKNPNIRILAVTSPARWQTLPEVPTFKEQGLPFSCLSWAAAFVPADTPTPVVARLRAAFEKTLADKDVRERLQKIGLDPWTDKLEAFDDYMKADLRLWETDIKRAGVALSE